MSFDLMTMIILKKFERDIYGNEYLFLRFEI